MPSVAARVRAVLLVQGIPLLLFALGVWWAARLGVGALDVALFVGMYVVTMLGVELGFHRYFAHRSFETLAWIRALFLVCGSMAGQGSALLWSAVHRVHHAHTDKPGDLHSPVLGVRGRMHGLWRVFWTQFLWYTEVPGVWFWSAHPVGTESPQDARDPQCAQFSRAVQDWRRDPAFVRLNNAYPLFILLGFALPTLIGFLVVGSAEGAARGLVFGGLLRYWVVQQVTFAINSVGHTVGVRTVSTADHSRNNVVMAVLTLGAGWHNNHHAQPAAFTTRWRWYQFDFCGVLIRALSWFGLASELRAPKLPFPARSTE